MRRLFPGLLVLLLAVMSTAPVRGQTTGLTTPQAGPSVDLSGVAPLPLTGNRQAEFETYIADILAMTGVPGAAVAVVQNGEVVYRQGFGVRELGGSESVTPETLMMIGSITKPMTATMAATVVDAGDATWDTPVVDLLPVFAIADPELTKRLSLRNAFCACTGLPQRDPEFLFNCAELTPERLITSVRDFPLTAPLGEQFQYSNQLFAIGGYAAAAAAEGATDLYDAYVSSMQRRLLDPLGMSRSTFGLDRVFASGNYAEPHGVDLAGAYHPVSLADDQRYVTAVAPAGALWSSATEMARFVQMELAAGLAPDEARVVSQANLEATWQPQVTIPAPANPDLPSEFVSMAQGYALGWVVGEYGGQRLLWHSGGTSGFSAQAALLPDADLGVVILTNGINAEFFTYAVQFRLFELVFDQPATFDPVIRAVIAATAQQQAELQQQLAPVDPARVAPYLGRYTHDVLGEVDIELGDGTLIFDAGEFRAELWPLRDAQTGETTYVTSDLPLSGVSTVTFAAEGDTPVMTFTDPTTGEAYVFTFIGRVDATATPSAQQQSPAASLAVG
jgi:CubicO group peptidase (beta-lactamase class C family)